MAEYIDRDAAIAACFDGFADCRDDCAANIRSIPTADVRPVVRGKWERRNTFFHNSIVKCSLCGNFLDLAGVNAGRGDANFCPNCGADMREES